MDRNEKVILDNKELINRFVDLMMCRDRILDSRHRWFYSLIPESILEALVSYITEDDIRQEIYLYIITHLKQYKRSDKEFSNWLKKAIGWRLRDLCIELASYYRVARITLLPQSQTEEPTITLRWVFFKDKNLPLTSYEKYILYLYLGKCYTITRISQITYQDRKTIREAIKDAIQVLKENYATTN